MVILLTSGNPLGMRPVGSGGRTAASSYEQITRTLRQTFGPDHAALFAEPSRRAGSIDWFAEAEPDTVPVRLVDAPPERLDPALDRLERLVRDIGAKASELQKSDRQDERILGEMLAQALDIPEEGAAFLVGERPVLTFWGHVKDRDRPAVNPIDALLRRRSGRRIVPPGDAAVEGIVAPSRPSGSPGRLLPVALWAILVLLIAVCAVELVRSCVLRLPHGLTSWISDTCGASSGGGTQAGLDEESSRQAALQTQFEDLTKQAGLKRQACLVHPGQNPPPGSGPVSLPPATPGPGTPAGPIVASKTDTPPDAPPTAEPPKTEPPKADTPPAQASKGGTLPDATQPPTTQPPDATPKPDTPASPGQASKTDTPPDATQPPKPDTPPADKLKIPPADKLKIPPDETKGIGFLEGCWRAHEGLTENHDGKQTGKVLKVTYCFGANGTGERTIRYLEDGGKCVGPIKANLDGETLTMEIGSSPCDAPHGRFDPATDRCKRSADGTAHCDEVQTDGKTTNFSDFPFTRTSEQP